LPADEGVNTPADVTPFPFQTPPEGVPVNVTVVDVLQKVSFDFVVTVGSAFTVMLF
jgi:hypothetical protein